MRTPPKSRDRCGNADPTSNEAIWDWYLAILVKVSDHACDLHSAEIATKELIDASRKHLAASPHESWDRRGAWGSHFQSLLGRILEKQGRTDEARCAYMAAITLNPELDEHVMNYVAFLMRRGFCDEALVQMHRLAKPCARDPDWRKAIETWCTEFPEYAERIRTECQTL